MPTHWQLNTIHKINKAINFAVFDETNTFLSLAYV